MTSLRSGLALSLLLLAASATAQDRPSEARTAIETNPTETDSDALSGIEPVLAGTHLLEIENANATVRLRLNDDGGFVLPGMLNSGQIPATGAGARLMWYPSKAAFRAGRVGSTQWNDDLIGQYSAAFGYNATADGWNSTAMGMATRASGSYSTSMGMETLASGFYSTAMGQSTVAGGGSSTAMGSNTTASGSYSVAMGFVTTASGLASTAMGEYSTASGMNSMAMGRSTAAGGDNSVAMGRSTTASGTASTAMGYRARAVHDNTFVWADGQNVDFNSASTNTFNVRASGGIRFRHGGVSAGTWPFQISNPNTSFVAGMRVTNEGFFDVTNHAPATTGFARLNNSGNWTATSDRRLKTDIVAAEGLLAGALRLAPMRYRFRDDASAPRRLGLMAQDVREVFPELVTEGEILTLDYATLSVVALGAIREQQAQIDALEAELGGLRSVAAENAVLREELAALQAEQAAGSARLAAIEAVLTSGGAAAPRLTAASD